MLLSLPGVYFTEDNHDLRKAFAARSPVTFRVRREGGGGKGDESRGGDGDGDGGSCRVSIFPQLHAT